METQITEVTDKPKYRFCWHCGRQLRGNFFATYNNAEDGHEYIVHRDCKEILDGKWFDYKKGE